MHYSNHLEELRATWGSETHPQLPVGTSLIRFPRGNAQTSMNFGCDCISQTSCAHNIA